MLVTWFKKTDYNTKISEIEGKVISHKHDHYVTIPEFYRLTAQNFQVRLKQANIMLKSNLDTELKIISDRVTSNKSRHLQIEYKLKILEKFDAAYFRSKSHFEEHGIQNYLVFQDIYR